MDKSSVSSRSPDTGRVGLVVGSCAVDVATAVDRCTAELARRGLRLFGVFDHGEAAQSVGLALAAEVVVVFGNPAVGTLLMQVDPTIGVELPLKLLLWEQGGVAQVGFLDPIAWSDRYAIPADHPVLTTMRHLLDDLAGYVAGPA